VHTQATQYQRRGAEGPRAWGWVSGMNDECLLLVVSSVSSYDERPEGYAIMAEDIADKLK
jgi:hypothetical protein